MNADKIIASNAWITSNTISINRNRNRRELQNLDQKLRKARQFRKFHPSTLRRTFKIMFVTMCISGFLYQTSAFLRMFLAYPTLVNILLEYPQFVSIPAITVCNQNGLLRNKFCKSEPEHCQLYTDHAKFCSLFPKICRKFPFRQESWSIPGLKLNSFLYNRSWEFIKAFSMLKANYTIDKCTIVTTHNKTDCRLSEPVPVVDEKGYPHFCYSIESLWGLPDAQAKIVPTSSRISMMLMLHPEEYMQPKKRVLAYVEPHDPHTRINPFVKGYPLEAGKQYKMDIAMVITDLLPSPYKSQCIEYLPAWRNNGGTGPINREECIDVCKIKEMINIYGCVSPKIRYPHNFTICDNEELLLSDEKINTCAQQCNNPCKDSFYNVKIMVDSEVPESCSNDDMYCRNKNVMVDIEFSNMRITRFHHEPQFENVEVFSYVGGYMGMWLGVSLMAVFDLLNAITKLLLPFCKFKKTFNAHPKLKNIQKGWIL